MSDRVWTPEIDAELIRLRHVEKRTWEFIGLQLGWSKAGSQERYNKILPPEQRIRLAARRMWTDEQSAELTRLRAEGKSCREIASLLGLTAGQVTSRLERMSRPSKRVHFERSKITFKVPQHCLYDRARRQEAQRDLTAMFCGDPEPGRSALDRKRLGIADPVYIDNRSAQTRRQPSLVPVPA